MENNYSALLDTSSTPLADSPSKYTTFTERHLQALWYEQKYLHPLVSSDGQPVNVISPGLWNAEAGPDFKKAHFKIGDLEIKGDVEIHLSEEDWINHRHHIDPRYDQVVVHIALWQPKTKRTLFTSQNSKLYQIFLEPFLTTPISQLAKLIDLDLFPYKSYVGSGRCSRALFKDLSLDKVNQFFKSAAEWRLIRKLSHLQVHACHPDEIIKIGASMALGYKNNAKEFLRAYLILREKKKHTETELFALALGCCGFFHERYHNWEHADYYKTLQSVFNKMNDKPQEQIVLKLNQIRPFNHPVRRLAILVKMIRDHSWDSLTSKLINIWDTCHHTKKLNEIRRQLNEAIPTYDDPYWNYHFTFNSAASVDKLCLLGDNLKQEIIINTFLPLLFAKIIINPKPGELETFRELYYSYPATGSGKAKYLSHRYFGDMEQRHTLLSAYIEQGAYQLHHDFCVHFEASCEGCPFVNRYKTIFQQY